MAIIRNTMFFVATLTACASFADDPPTPIEPEAVALGRPVDFVRDVQPILAANCTACHHVGSDESDLSLESVDAMFKGGGRGPALVPSKPDESLLLAVAAHRREPVMPPADNDVKAKDLTPRELGILRQWIIEGAAKGEAAGSMIAWRLLPSDLKSIRSVSLSPTSRFVAAARGNQAEVYDLVLGGPPSRLVDPHLASLTDGSTPLYPHGAADRDLVQSVAFGPDGMTLASGGYRAIKLWRRAGLAETTPVDIAGVNATAMSTDGATLAVAAGNEVKLLATADGSVSATWPVPAKVTALAFSADGQRIAAVCEDNSIQAWSRNDGQAEPPRASPSPAIAITFAGDRIVTARDVGILNVWAARSDQLERELKGSVDRVTQLVPIPGQPNGIVSAGEDGAVRVWDVTNENPLRTITHGSPVSGIAVAPDAKIIASCGADGAVRIWNLADGAKLVEHVGLIARKRDEQKSAETLEWRKQLVAVADGRVKAAEAAVKEREEIQKKAVEAKDAALKAVPEAKKAADDAASAAKTAAEQSVAKPEDEALKKQTEEATKKAETAQAASVAAEAAARSAERALELAEAALKSNRERFDSIQQAKAAADASAKSAEAEANAKKAIASQPVPATALAFTPDGSRFVAGYAEGTLQIFSMTGVPLDTITIAGGGVSKIGFGAGGDAYVSSQDGVVRRADVTGRWTYAATLGPPQDAPLDLARSPIADRVLTLAFSPDGQLLASGGGKPSRAGELMLWNIADRNLTKTFTEPHSDSVQAVAFSHDGKALVTAGADKFARTFDVESGAMLHTFEGHTEQVLGIAMKADGTAITSGSADLGVKVWNVESGEQQRTITGHGKQVTAVRYVGLTEDVVTAAGDKTVRLYHTSNGQQIRAFGGATDYVNAVDVNPDGSTIVAGGEDGVLFVWDGKTGALRQRFEPPGTDASTATAAK